MPQLPKIEDRRTSNQVEAAEIWNLKLEDNKSDKEIKK
jgi:hypothetical protein